MKKYLFFDVDGTLMPFGKRLPDSARKALLDAHNNGHELFLATGRGMNELEPELLELPFVGGIFSAGAVCIYKDEKVVNHIFTQSQLTELYDIAKEYDLDYLIQSSNWTVMTKEFKKIFFEMFSGVDDWIVDFPNLKEVEDYPLDLDIMKMVAYSEKGEMSKIKALLAEKYDVVDNSFGVSQDCFSEISLKNITKASGFLEMVNYLNIDVKDTYFCGDEMNDLDIAKVVGTSIALGNACEELKKISDYITSDINLDGIKNALEHFNLITTT